MRIINRVILLALVAVISFYLLSGCIKSEAAPRGNSWGHISFRDIPGVTEDEIKAIETFQKQSASFVYGMPYSTEAFMKEDGEIDGNVILLCEWLSALFGIQFEPALYEWSDLIAKLNTSEVNFTGAMMVAEERMETYLRK